LGPFDCSFEEDTDCAWSETQVGDQLDWESIQPMYQGLDIYSAPQDHTLGTNDGNLLHIPNSEVRHPNDTAFLTSPVITPYDALQGNCLTFWYRLYGPSVDGIQVYRIVENTKTLVWQRIGTQGPNWKMAQIETVDVPNYQLQIVGLRGITYLGSTDLDDIHLTTSACPFANFSLNNDCDFEHGMCGFTYSTSSSSQWFLWLLHSSSTNTAGTGPSSDHTYGSPIGHYIYLEATTRAPSEATSILSPSLTINDSNVCLRFWYSMYGDTMGELQVYYLYNRTRQLLWNRAGNQGPWWLMAEVSISIDINSTMILEFEGVIGSSDLSDIALDDISLRSGSCESNDACSFEHGLCSWANSKYGDNFDWIIGFGATPSFSTGPKADNTIGNGTGHYAFIEASAPQKYGDRAYLVSQIFEATPIIFEGTVGYNYEGDIAIDDISFSSDFCSIQPQIALSLAVTTTVGTVTTTLQPFTTIPTPYDCNFEIDFCGWIQDTTDNFNWTRSQGPAGSTQTGPIIDHTVGNDQGWYIFVEEGEQYENDTARVISPKINPGQRCFRFYYTMFGPNVYMLNAYIRQDSGMSLIFRKIGDKGEVWQIASIPVNPTGVYQLVLEGVRGRTAGGNIAVDDIAIPSGLCPEKSIESGAVYCTFENQPVNETLCGFTQETDDNFDWSLSSKNSQNTEPYTDHTYGSFTGHYIYTDGSSPQKANDTARIRSPTYAPGTSQQHCLTFFYEMFGADIGTLNVYQVTAGQSVLGSSAIWSRSYDMGPGWRKAEVTIHLLGNYQLIFEGILGDGDKSDIALDDIMIKNGFCPNPRTCSFTNDICEWRNIVDGTDKFDWLWSKGESAPIPDHTSGTSSGYYMFIDYTSNRQSGDRARLASQMFPPSQNKDYCFSFWYNIFGSDIGSLKVLVMFNASYDIITSEATLWQWSNQTNAQWMSAQVILEGVTEGGEGGSIAVDDTNIEPYTCQTVPAGALPLSDVIKVADCNFDVGYSFCNWDESSDRVLNWFVTDPNGSPNVGPASDHTGHGGRYLYVDPSDNVEGAAAILYSPVLPPTDGLACFSFWYHMYGEDIGQLQLLTSIGDITAVLWQREGNQANKWLPATVTIESKTNYQSQLYKHITNSPYLIMAALRGGAGKVADVATSRGTTGVTYLVTASSPLLTLPNIDFV
ncbi:hypothetical protein Btru_072226, partial [Bulinus truncatus]